jgi:hypothetical protein
MTALLAARLNVARAGGDLRVLDGLHAQQLDRLGGALIHTEDKVKLAEEGDRTHLLAEDEAQTARPFASVTR